MVSSYKITYIHNSQHEPQAIAARFHVFPDMRCLDGMDIEPKREILQAAKSELLRHSWGSYVDNPPSMAEGGTGVVVPGRETVSTSLDLLILTIPDTPNAC